MKFLGRNSQKWAQESRFSAEKDGTTTEVSENGHFRVGHLEGSSAGPILRGKWIPMSQRAILPLGTFFSDAHPIGQLANWIIDQIFEIELGFGNCSDWHLPRRDEVFRPKFAKMGQGEPISARKWNINGGSC